MAIHGTWASRPADLAFGSQNLRFRPENQQF